VIPPVNALQLASHSVITLENTPSITDHSITHSCQYSPAPATPERTPGAAAETLEALRSPATTTSLARALNVTLSAVSQHLRVLRDNGLVTGQRCGRTVLCLTTESGLALLNPSPA
jgi:DNA-binding transcriptional ArsR family regulator